MGKRALFSYRAQLTSSSFQTVVQKDKAKRKTSQRYTDNDNPPVSDMASKTFLLRLIFGQTTGIFVI